VECVECGTVAAGRARDWRAYLTSDDPPEVVCYCPKCAKHAFGTLNDRGLARLGVRVASAAEPLHAVLAECGADMQKRLGLSHWVPPYPLSRLQAEVDHGKVYEVVTANAPVATFTLLREPPEYVDNDHWSAAGEPAVYVTRLAVRPDLQRQGIGRFCMEWIEQHAGATGARSIRLDAYTRHEGLPRFYRRLGYVERGTYEAFGAPLTCFEKIFPD
jgi:GNAT superfamily N-acetyltransferase